MSYGNWSGDVIEPHDVFCANSCGRLAETEVPAGLSSDGTEHVDLVCHPCRAASLTDPGPDRTATRTQPRRTSSMIPRRTR